MGTLITLIIGKLIGIGLMKWFGAGRTAKAIEFAGDILGDANNTVTDLRKAAEQALIQERYQELDVMVAELDRQKRLGEIEIRRAESGPKLLDGMQVEIVPPDGTEEFRSPWKDKPR